MVRTSPTFPSGPTFRTEVPIRPLSHAPLLRHEEPLLLLGSCFSDGVGRRLQAAGHNALANPLGTLFSPASIRRATELLAEGPAASWDPPRYDERAGLWYTFDAGATIARPTREAAEAAVDEALTAGHAQLRRSACLFVTLGSAWRRTFYNPRTRQLRSWPQPPLPAPPHLAWRREVSTRPEAPSRVHRAASGLGQLPDTRCHWRGMV